MVSSNQNKMCYIYNTWERASLSCEIAPKVPQSHNVNNSDVDFDKQMLHIFRNKPASLVVELTLVGNDIWSKIGIKLVCYANLTRIGCKWLLKTAQICVSIRYVCLWYILANMQDIKYGGNHMKMILYHCDSCFYLIPSVFALDQMSSSL